MNVCVSVCCVCVYTHTELAERWPAAAAAQFMSIDMYSSSICLLTCICVYTHTELADGGPAAAAAPAAAAGCTAATAGCRAAAHAAWRPPPWGTLIEPERALREPEESLKRALTEP